MSKTTQKWTVVDSLVLVVAIVSPIVVWILSKDSWIGLLSSVTGILYVFLCAKGKLMAYGFGLVNCFAYAYLSAIEKLYGEVLLNLLYYVPLQCVGFLTWRRWMNQQHSVIPKCMRKRSRFLCLGGTLLGTLLLGTGLKHFGGEIAYVDAFTTVASVVAMTLTARRYIEQWYYWFAINTLSIYMWTLRYLENGQNGATLYMWIVFFFIGVYGYVQWKRQLSDKAVEERLQ